MSSSDEKYIVNLFVKIRKFYTKEFYKTNIKLAQKLLQRFSIQDICAAIYYYQQNISTLAYLTANNYAAMKRIWKHKRDILKTKISIKYKLQLQKKQQCPLFNAVSRSNTQSSRNNLFKRLRTYGKKENGQG